MSVAANERTRPPVKRGVLSRATAASDARPLFEDEEKEFPEECI